MLYQRSMDIERRLESVLRLVRSGGYSTPMIAQELGVSIPTVSRDVTALRERGHDIQSERKNDSWHYVLLSRAPLPRRRSFAEARQ
jgi:predicted DNA-binding transcriptional regulator YafY